MFTFFHRLLALSLIIALSSSSSFAAVSVSDGSAFVSKAEFAANLNNLNSRMSNLENSLDAKIDSLVSSYLSRNGIWNGEKQTVVGDGKTTRSVESLINYNLKSQNNISYTCNLWRDAIQINKSGLAFITLSFTGVSNLGYNEIIIKAENWANANDVNGITGVFTVGFYTNTIGSSDNFINSISSTAGSSIWRGSYSGMSKTSIKYLYLPLPWGKHVLFGFVNKGDKVSFATNTLGYCAYYGATMSMSGEGIVEINISNCSVY